MDREGIADRERHFRSGSFREVIWSRRNRRAVDGDVVVTAPAPVGGMTSRKEPLLKWELYEIAMEIVSLIKGDLERIERRDRNLGSQIREAVTSMPMNLAEGNWRVGRDRNHHFRTAAGSANETRCGLQIAVAFGYIDEPVEINARLASVLRILRAMLR